MRLVNAWLAHHPVPQRTCQSYQRPHDRPHSKCGLQISAPIFHWGGIHPVLMPLGEDNHGYGTGVGMLWHDQTRTTAAGCLYWACRLLLLLTQIYTEIEQWHGSSDGSGAGSRSTRCSTRGVSKRAW